jgi:hypothetical protein
MNLDWLFLVQIFGLTVILLLSVFIIMLCDPIRRMLKEIDLFSGDCRQRKFARFYEKHLHSLVIIRQALLFLAPIAGSIVFLGFAFTSANLTSLIVLGLSFIVFVSMQLPMLMKAHILATFKIGDNICDSTIFFETEKETLVEGRIYNLGFSTYKNFTVIFYFGGDFEIVPYDDEKYRDVDFKKKFGIQKIHGGAFFSPKDTSLIIPPQEVFIFPMYVKAPKGEKKGKMHIEFFSENSWGMTMIQKPFIVKNITENAENL